MFDEIFTTFYKKNPEILVMGVWGKDGLVLENRQFSDNRGIDLDFAGAELAYVLSRMDKIKIEPQKYHIKIALGDNLVLVYSLTPDFFLVILTDKSIIFGKLNFYFEIFREKIVALL